MFVLYIENSLSCVPRKTPQIFYEVNNNILIGRGNIKLFFQDRSTKEQYHLLKSLYANYLQTRICDCLETILSFTF